MDIRMPKAARQAPPSPIKPSALKIQTEEYADTPSSSGTASPVDSCASNVRKLLKPWERSASIASSANSSETSDLLWEDDVIDAEEQPGNSIVSVNNVKTSTRALRMQTHLRSMQRRLHGLQRLVQEVAEQGRLRSYSQESTADTQTHPVPVAGAGKSANLQKRAAPACTDELVLSPGESIENIPIDEAIDSPDDQHDSIPSSRAEDGPSAMTALLTRIKTLQGQLKEATGENQRLRNSVHRLKEENARLQIQTACNPTEHSGGGSGGSSYAGDDQESSGAQRCEAREDQDESIARFTTAIYGEPSAFQMVMVEDLAVLKNHERCQHKLRELWDTIRVLRTFVETYELERNAMMFQRDEAFADAERADAENLKLASSSNPQQKIKYLQQVKKDNQALRQKNRALNVRIVKQAAKLIREKNACSLLEGDGETVESATLENTQVPERGEASVRTGEEILRSVRDRSEVLEQRLDRLRLAKKGLPKDDEGDISNEEASGSETELRTDSAAV